MICNLAFFIFFALIKAESIETYYQELTITA